MDSVIYEACRLAMFGEEALSFWSDKDLEDKQYFIDWAFNEDQANIMNDPDIKRAELSKSEVKTLLSEVFDAELSKYRAEQEQEE